MHALPTTLLLLTPLALALALPSTTNTTTLHPRALYGSCTTSHFPTEPQYTLGYTTFCATYLPSLPSKKTLSESAPLVATFDLTNHMGGPVRWVYKVWVADTTPLTPIYEFDVNECVDKFKKILETSEGGGLGKAYCVVDGTGGDKVGEEGMSGQGDVLVMGGKLKFRAAEGQNGYVYYETRGRLDG